MADAAYVVLIFATFLACVLVLRGLNGRTPHGRAVEARTHDRRAADGRASGEEGAGR